MEVSQLVEQYPTYRVRRVADDIPTYVIENAKGDPKVIHWAGLLLWSSCDEDQEGLQMTVDQLTIFVSLSALEPLLEGEKRCRVRYEWSITGFGLNLAIFKPMLEVSELKTGPRPQQHVRTRRRRKELANGGSLGRKPSLQEMATLFWWGMLHLELGHTE